MSTEIVLTDEHLDEIERLQNAIRKRFPNRGTDSKMTADELDQWLHSQERKDLDEYLKGLQDEVRNQLAGAYWIGDGESCESIEDFKRTVDHARRTGVRSEYLRAKKQLAQKAREGLAKIRETFEAET